MASPELLAEHIQNLNYSTRKEVKMSDLNTEVMVDNVGISDGTIYAADSADNVSDTELTAALKENFPNGIPGTPGYTGDEILWQGETLIGKEDESTTVH